MRKLVLGLAALMLAGAAPAAPSGHDGKIDFIHDPAFGLAKARLEGKSAMLFFTADWCGFCKKLAAGAFSDDKVAAASARVVPVYYDCTDREAFKDIKEKYGVSGLPTVVYVDVEGKKLKDIVGQSDASAYISAIDNVAKKLPGRASLWQNTAKSAAAAAKAAKKPYAIYVAKADADPLKVTAGLMKNLGDRKTKLIWTWETGTEETLKRLELESAPAIVIYDSVESEGEVKPLGKVLLTKDDAKTLTEGIDGIIKK